MIRSRVCWRGVLWILAGLFVVTGRHHAAVESYPWSESSDDVRVSKALLTRIELSSVMLTNVATMNFVVTPEFAMVFRMTPEEIRRVGEALVSALHEYRTIRAQHFEPLDEPRTLARASQERPYASGRFRFRLRPFEGAAAAVRSQLEADIREILGEERSSHFMRMGRKLEGELKAENHDQLAAYTYVFRLLKEPPGPLVDLRVESGGGFYGRPYGEPLHRYAPDPLKPILAGWREWIAQQPPATFDWNVHRREGAPTTIPEGHRAGGWDDSLPYVDVSKDLIGKLRIPVLGEGERLAAEAIALFGLRPEEVTAVEALYDEMKGRVNVLERAHLERIEGVANAFVVREFQPQMDALQKEWVAALGALLGSGRGELLDHTMRNTPYFTKASYSSRGLQENPGPRWFNRGCSEARIQFSRTTRANAAGSGGAARFEFQYEEGEAGASGGGPGMHIPLRFQHLLTPDMLTPME